MGVLETLRQRLAQDGHLVLDIRARPNARVSKVKSMLDDGSLKVDIAAVPEAGKANAELVEFLASELDVPVSHVEITAGHTANRKRIHIAL